MSTLPTAPKHIDPNCPNCGALLVLDDLWEFERDWAIANDDADSPELWEPWEDEWICAKCRDGCYLDWPQEQVDDIRQRADAAEVAVAMEEIDERKRLLTWEDMFPDDTPPTEEQLEAHRREADRKSAAYQEWLAKRVGPRN